MEARLRFEEAEAIQRAYHPEHPYLMAEMGFDYCDLLLIIPERNAWLSTLELPLVEQSSTVLNICQQVSHRATQTLDWWTKQFLLNAYLTDFASNKLTLGRVMIYEAIVTQSSLAPCGDFLHAAVDSIRTTNDNILLINGLLTNAWCLFLQGRITGTDSAQSDLDEACEIAERGPMPLFLADIHLYRARLFGSWKREAKYPWQSPQHDLAEARRLIEKHGYWRRKEELEDAEEAAQNW